MTNSISKPCTKCGEPQPLTNYSQDKRATDGKSSRCKSCDKRYREANKEQLKKSKREYYEANRERVLAECREYRLANVEKKRESDRRWRENNEKQYRESKRRYRERNKEAIAEYQTRYWQENREQLSEYRRAYYLNNLERFAELRAEYYRNNPEIWRVSFARRKARKLAAKGSHTAEDIRDMYGSQGGLCAYCETPLFDRYHVDHMLPLSRGGADDWTNLALTCPECNLRKGTKTAEEFCQRLLGIKSVSR